jgi:8-oxo-dGTP pyrophosphatase MutT (NUDIX family)
MTPHQLTSNVKLLQKVVLLWEGKILMLQRSSDSASRPLCWDLPGGNSEWPEGITEPTSNLHQFDAAREIQEETGLVVDPSEFTQDKLSYLETFFDPQSQIFTVLLGWKIELASSPQAVAISEEHVDSRWLSVEEALKLDFGGKKGGFLAKIIQNSR